MTAINTARARASRANARKSTGPKTPDGKAASARNARQHGLSLPVLLDPGFAPEVGALARRITQSVVGTDSDPRHHELACRVAEAQLDLVRVRRSRPRSRPIRPRSSRSCVLTAMRSALCRGGNSPYASSMTWPCRPPLPAGILAERT